MIENKINKEKSKGISIPAIPALAIPRTPSFPTTLIRPEKTTSLRAGSGVRNHLRNRKKGKTDSEAIPESRVPCERRLIRQND